MSRGVLTLGIQVDNRLQKAVQRSMTIKNPDKIPKLKGIAPRKPLRLALDMDMMLLGPGVTEVTAA